MLDSPRTLSDALRLDRRFQKAVYEVEQRIGLLNRQAAVRVRSWLHHLSLPTENLTWKRNRNQHCHVLLHQLGKGRLTQPFDREPADGPVGNLPSHVLADWKAAVRSRSGRKSSQFLASESPAYACVPKPSLSEPPLPYSGHPRASQQAVNSAPPLHRRSVSAQASFHRCQDAQLCMPRHHHSQLNPTERPSTSLAGHSSQVQRLSRQEDAPNCQPSAVCGCASAGAMQTVNACEMHKQLLKCRNLLEQRTAAKTRSQPSSCTHPRMSQLHHADLSVPDVRVQLNGVQHGQREIHPVVNHAKRHRTGVGQINRYAPPPTFVGTLSDPPYMKATASLARLQSIADDVQPVMSCSQEMALPRTHSSDSCDDTKMVSLSCSTESSGSTLDLSRSPEVEQKPLSMHPNILRAHLDKMQLAEQDMLRSCATRAWHCAQQRI